MSRAKGDAAESRACEYLSTNGYTIVQRNFYSRFGEIDIIAFKDEVLHFVEVKSGEEYESAVQNITPQKMSRVLRTADVYIKKNALECAYVYDAIIVTPASIDMIENITF
ncbi:YraN family protein [Sulfurimonas sp. HSL-1716]|uniref:YraN family protein n=1 Tax=Hydrocurvibacter sulfurireducens TaxID=3131937 RepID=UPI0031FA1977